MNETRTADAVVVGAGPAGAATALLLARAGHDVVLLDRAEFPRPKPCGDCLSAAASAVLERLGVLGAVDAAGPARLRGWRILAPSGAAFEADFADCGHTGGALALRRDRLDAALVEAAQRAGAELRCGFHVTGPLRAPDGRVLGVAGRTIAGGPAELRGRIVVAADGLRSVLAARLGLVARRPRLRKISLTAHVTGIAGVDRAGEMHVGDGACAGLAPVAAPGDAAAAECNLTLVVDAERFGRAAAADAESFFWMMLSRFPGLADRLPGARSARAGPLLASGPFDRPTRAAAAGPVALVGDAAGYFDPFTGQGIYHALTGAELLAEHAEAALRGCGRPDRSLRRYAHRLRRQLRGDHALEHAIEAVVSRPALADLAIRRLSRAPRAAEALLAAAGNLRPAHSLLSPRLALSLLFHPVPQEAPS